jgi:hypothetical protein
LLHTSVGGAAARFLFTLGKEVDLAVSVLDSCKAALAGKGKGGRANLGTKRKAKCLNDAEGGEASAPKKRQKRPCPVCHATLHSQNSNCSGKNKRKCQKEANKRKTAQQKAKRREAAHLASND